jgi:hypothetical protein
MQTRIAAVVGLVLLASGCRVIEPNPPPEAPRIGSFTASKTRIAPGEQVTLSFTTTGATKVQVTDDAGNDVALTGEVAEGSATVAPTRSSFYVLRATGEGGRDTAFVQIAVNEALKDVFLIAVPGSISSGEQAQLLWGAAGATGVTLTTGAGMPQALTGTTGAVTVSPATSERYTLTAQGAPGTPPLTAIAEVQVRPVLASATLTAIDGVEAGKTLTFAWRTAGAAKISISESTFGQLTTVTEPSSVVMGTFDYVLPAKLPSGIDVSEGLPLHFTVSAIAGDVVISRTLDRVVGQKPVIELFSAPESVSVGKRFTVEWKTLNATEITITSGGLPLFRSLPGNQARVDQGSLTLPAPLSQTTYELVASNDRGLSTSRSFTVKPVALPVINTYTLTGSFANVGDPVTARWTTTNATSVTVRFEGGATIATVTTPSQVASGNVVLTPTNTSRITVEAANAAGDVVRETKTVNFTGTPVVVVTPTPVLRGGAATIDWTLAPVNVLEVVGLPTPAPAPVPSSPNYVDLNTVTSAQTLFFTDTTDGSALIPALPGFRFPMLGQVQENLWVSVNGFIAFSKPAALTSNTDLADAGDSAPSMLAPLWDNLTLAGTSKVLYALLTAPNNERYLVVQWDKMQLAGDANSELTFQAQLYETGQVTFVYKTITPAVNSATIGVKDTSFPAGQVYAFNSTTAQPVADLELNYFTGGPANGSVPFKASGSRQINFVGRLAQGRVVASAEVRAFGTGDITINEVMPFPEATATAGQWVEFKNNTGGTLNVEGLVVDTLGSDAGGFVFPANTTIDAGALFVIGQSTNPADNGGATVNLAATDIPMGPVDRVRLSVADAGIATFSWDAGTAGTSLQPGDLLVATGATFACPRMVTFGPNGAIGTPGAANESCAPYVITQIPGGFIPAPAGSTILSSISGDDDYGNVTLPQAFTYFGAATTEMGLSTNGFITLGAGALSTSSATNATTPSSTTPNGTLAVFWDDLVRGTGKNAMWREADRTVVSWEGFYLYSFTYSASATNTVVNAQIHLLDTGVIEFHYGEISTTITAQSFNDQLSGNSATIWLERQDGNVAVPWAINQLNGIKPNSGLRFTPRP